MIEMSILQFILYSVAFFASGISLGISIALLIYNIMVRN